jgi:hypothetical protein
MNAPRLDRLSALVDGLAPVVTLTTGRAVAPTAWEGAEPDSGLIVYLMSAGALRLHRAGTTTEVPAPALVALQARTPHQLEPLAQPPGTPLICAHAELSGPVGPLFLQAFTEPRVLSLVDDEPALRHAAAWMAARGWSPFPSSARSGPPWRGAAAACCTPPPAAARPTPCGWGALRWPMRPPRTAGLQVLWLTPMRALAADTTRALQQPLPDLAPAWTVGQRSGDTPSAERARQDRRCPGAGDHARIAEPAADARKRARGRAPGVHTVIVDEWHELIGNKRGVQVQLALARLRRWNPGWWCGACRPRWATWTRRWQRCWARAPRARVCWCAGASTKRWSSTRCCRRARPLLLGRPPGRADAAAGGDRDRASSAPRWSSPTCARRPRSGTSCC